jgi:hypothetical protein
MTDRDKAILETALADWKRRPETVCPEYFQGRANGVCHGCGYAFDDNGNCKCNGR